MVTESIIVAKRWDGLGGRLHAILNAWSAARALEREFRFVWPRNAFGELQEPRELFSDGFLDRFEISESDCADCVHCGPGSLRLSEMRDTRQAEMPSRLEISECFEVFAFGDETPEAARERFRRGLREIAWSRASQALVEAALEDADGCGYAAIHIRAGDIVTGGWRQFVPVEKYAPLLLVERAIDELSDHDRLPVVVVSDNDSCVQHLKTRFSVIRTPGDLFAGYADLTEVQRAFADILALAQARRLVGPRLSAFSQLSAHLGGSTLQSLDQLIVEEDTRRWFPQHLAQIEERAERSAFLPPLLARDICWFLDVFSDHLEPGEQLTLARRAIGYDPDFCGALNRSAAALARTGEHAASGEASARAQIASAKADRHADPMVETLATAISASLSTLVTRPRSHARAVLADARGALAKCEVLKPFQIQHSDVLFNLRFQIAALAWLTAADDELRAVAQEAMDSSGRDPAFLSAWRPSGAKVLREPGSFPQVLRNLETVTVRIAYAIGKALILASQESHPPSLVQVEGMTVSPTGLRWVTGWVRDTGTTRGRLAVAWGGDGTFVSGGPAHLRRPDVIIEKRHGQPMGFAFPVPLSMQEAPGSLRAGIRVQGSDPHVGPLACLRQFRFTALSSRIAACWENVRGKTRRPL